MKTLLGTEIPETTRGVLYLCDFDRDKLTITVVKEILTLKAWVALELYANIPNPESQLAVGGSFEELCEELELLHKNMKDPKWLGELEECL